jgi:hypothetical protein
MGCGWCSEFCGHLRIERSDRLDQILTAVAIAVREGRLSLEAGELTRSDYVECDLSCRTRGQRFTLRCETYHGSGGEWRPV